MRAPLAAAVASLLAVTALAGCVGTPLEPARLANGLAGLPVVGDVLAPPLAFGAPVVVDAEFGGSEPSLVVDPEGRIFVAAPVGLANGQQFSGQFWRSLDDGASFEHLEGLGVGGLYGPSFGGGDSDIATDAQGNLYAIDLWLGNTGFLTSQDHGDSWLRGSPYTFATPGNDRQWIDINQATGEVYIVVNSFSSGLWVVKSNDAGLTFPQQTLATAHADRGDCICPPGVLAVDEATGNLYLPYYRNPQGVGIAVSTDGGSTFTNYVVPGTEGAHLPDDEGGEVGGSFTVAATDTVGNVYLAWEQPMDHGRRIMLQTSQDAGASWSEPVFVSDIPAGEQIFPWLVAGEPGRVALAWYEISPDQEWDVRLAFTEHALDGAPRFRLSQLNPEPIATGAYDRSLVGDFFELALGPDGRVHAVWNAATGSGPTIQYAQQVDGPRLLTGAPVPPAAAPKPLAPSVPAVKPVAPDELAEEMAHELGLPPPPEN